MSNVFWKTNREGYFIEQDSRCKCERAVGDVVRVSSTKNPICPKCELSLVGVKSTKSIIGGHMTLSEFELYYDKLVEAEKKLLESKGIEYSGKEDRFNNFRKLGIELKMAPEKVLWVYLKKHLDGILSYIHGEYAGGEPIIGRINDARNYLALLAGMIDSNEFPIRR